MNVIYYIEIRLKQPFRNKKIPKIDIKYIKNRKGLKLELKNAFIKLYPNNISKNRFEIGAVTIRKKGFFTRFIYNLNENDLKNEIINPGMNEIILYENLEFELKNYCLNLFNLYKQQITQIFFNHYKELDSNKFEIIYFREYPNNEKDFIGNVNEGEGQSNIYENEGINLGEYDNDIAAPQAIPNEYE
eukprot:100429_1